MIVEVPAATLVTVTLAEVDPPVKLTVAGTVAAEVLLELKLTVMPPVGAWPPVRLRTSVPEPLTPTLRVAGENAIVGAVTVAVPVLVMVRPLPFHVETVPVMVAEPMPWPTIVAVPVVLPAVMLMLDGVGTLPVLLDVKFTVTPPVGAACVNVTVRLVDRPKPTDGLLSVMPMTLAVAVAFVKLA